MRTAEDKRVVGAFILEFSGRAAEEEEASENNMSNVKAIGEWGECGKPLFSPHFPPWEESSRFSASVAPLPRLCWHFRKMFDIWFRKTAGLEKDRERNWKKRQNERTSWNRSTDRLKTTFRKSMYLWEEKNFPLWLSSLKCSRSSLTWISGACQ